MTKQEAIGVSQTANVKSVMTVRAAAKNGPGVKRKLYIGLMKFLMGLSITITCGLVLFMIGYVLYRGVPNISWKLVSTSPSYLDDNIGILPDILNTLYIVIATLVIVLPLGVGAAIYLTEYATNKKIVGMIEYAAETLSGIPSIIYGLVGMLFFCQFLSLQTSLLAGALTLVIMNLPTIMRTTQESLKTVPQSYREGAFGLGAGKWRVIRTVVLPGCIDGVVTGCILSVGRIIGESAALLFTAGLAHAVNGMIDGLHSAGATLTVALYMYAKEQGEFGVAFAIAAVVSSIFTTNSKDEAEEIETTEKTNDKKETRQKIYAPVKGTAIPQDQIKDETFASGMLGKGVGIRPSESVVYAPFDGVISSVTETKHAVGMVSDQDVQLLIHIGIDTVKMNGEGFKVFVKDGQAVQKGDKLIEFDREKIKAANFDDIVVTLVINSDEYQKVECHNGACEENDVIMNVE